MYIGLDREGTVKGFQKLLDQADKDDSILGILVLACDENSFTPKEIDGILKQCSKPIFGGIFYSIIHNDEKLQKGTIIAGIHKAIDTVTIENISSIDDFNLHLNHTFDLQSIQDKTMFVFLDGLSQYNSRIVDGVFNSYGSKPNYIGGGAGVLDERKPCLITNKGLLKDAAVLAVADIEGGIGVAHGWKKVFGPLKVTEAEYHTINSINWRPAFEVYKEIVENLSRKLLKKSEFYQLSQEYPLGIVRMSDEMIIREPISVENNNLICGGEMSPNSFIYILQGDKETLIKGAAKARQMAEDAYFKAANIQEKPSSVLFIDCISRAFYLKSQFDEELRAVYQGLPLIGALSLGEIGNIGKSYLEFYNKTSVVGYLGG